MFVVTFESSPCTIFFFKLPYIAYVGYDLFVGFNILHFTFIKNIELNSITAYNITLLHYTILVNKIKHYYTIFFF